MADRPPWIHGSTVDKKTRELRFVSVSAINSADAADGGCPRKWAFRYIDGIKQPETDKQRRGVEGHAEIEAYETTGDSRAVGPEVAQGLHVVPEPGADLNVEWDVLKWPGVVYPDPLTEAHSAALLHSAPVKYAGVPLTGFIDCWHRRGTNKGTMDITQVRDPAGTLEVIDWKFVGSMQYAKGESELAHMTQLASYGRWAFTVYDDVPAVRLSLGYFPRKGRPQKVSKLVHREDVEEQCDHAAGVVRLLQHVAKEPSAESVEANTSACDKYGGCFYRSLCSAPMRTTLSMLVGKTMAEAAIARASGAPAAPVPAGNFVPLARVKAPAMASLLKKPTPTLSAPAKPTEAEIAAEQARLAEAEKRARLQAAVPADFPAACNRVKKHNLGFPTLLAAAARALHAMEGLDSDAEVKGTGDISYVNIEACADMTTLADELDQQAAENGESVPVLPPDAPASDPAKAADMLPEEGEVGGEEEAPVAEAAPAVEAKPAEVAKPVEAPKKTRSKKPAVGVAADPRKADYGRPVDEDGNVTDEPERARAIHVFVDVSTTVPAVSLDAWALGLAESLAVASGLKDVRIAPEGHNLAFAKWRGALAAMAAEAPLPPSPSGNYILHTYGEILGVVAEALVSRALATGGAYTRGARS